VKGDPCGRHVKRCCIPSGTPTIIIPSCYFARSVIIEIPFPSFPPTPQNLILLKHNQQQQQQRNEILEPKELLLLFLRLFTFYFACSHCSPSRYAVLGLAMRLRAETVSIQRRSCLLSSLTHSFYVYIYISFNNFTIAQI